MKLMTLKSNDFVDYFDVNEFYHKSRVGYSPKNWCGLRSTRVKQLTNMDMDFGMVFSKQNHLMHTNWKNSALDFHGYIEVSSIHVWNTQGDFLYDSQNQSELCDFNLVGIGQEVGVVDASPMNELLRKWNPKNQDKLIKFFKKSLFNASRYGIQNVYFRGFSLDVLKGAYHNPSSMKGNYEDWDVLVNQYFSKYSAVSK